MQFKTATLAQQLIPPHNLVVQPTNQARQEQSKQSFVTALAEIDELKQTLRYLEISLAKSKEEKEKFADRVVKEQEANEVCFLSTYFVNLEIDRRLEENESRIARGEV